MTFVFFFARESWEGGSRFIGIRGPSAIEFKAESLLDAPHVWIFLKKNPGSHSFFSTIFFFPQMGVKETTHSNIKN